MRNAVDPATFLTQFQLFLGFDWAMADHDVVAVDRDGRIVLDQAVADTAEGWADFRRRLVEVVGPDLSQVAVAVETCNGPAVERLLALGCRVYPLNPKAAQSYRKRKSVSGAKSDRLDAWSFGDGLRTDGHGWRQLQPEDPLTQELRLLCRDEVGLIEQRTALVLQLKAALHEYYPALLAAFDTWTSPSAWAFLHRFPTPAALVTAGPKRHQKLLHTLRFHHPERNARRLEIFAQAAQSAGPAPVVNAKSRLALALVKQLQVLDKQLQEYRQAIEALFARHPDHDIFGSLPGLGAKTPPRLLAEIGALRERFASAQSLQTYAGTAPVTHQSGRRRAVLFRLGCNKYLRAAVNYLADFSRDQCVWAQVYYQRKLEQGMTHAAALRCLGQRWLKILWKMWQTHSTYDEALHTRNQTKHGSWVVALAAT
jgi:transposase